MEPSPSPPHSPIPAPQLEPGSPTPTLGSPSPSHSPAPVHAWLDTLPPDKALNNADSEAGAQAASAVWNAEVGGKGRNSVEGSMTGWSEVEGEGTGSEKWEVESEEWEVASGGVSSVGKGRGRG